MAVQGEAKTPEEKRFMLAYAGAFIGVIVGALLGAIVVSQRMGNVVAATVLGAAVGGAIGFGAPSLAIVGRDFLGGRRRT